MKNRKEKHRKLLSLLLSLAMVIGMLPVTSFEARAEGTVCRIGEAEYDSVQAAVNAVQENETITMTADVILTDTIMIFSKSPAFTLDLNGHTISGAAIPVSDTDNVRGSVISNQTTLTIRDSSNSSAGKITGGVGRRAGGKFYGGGIINYATLTLEGGSICNNGSKNDQTTTFGGGIYNQGTVIIDGGIVENNEAAYGGGIYSNASNYISNITIKDGSISENRAASFCGGIYNYGGTLTMTGGVIEKNEAQWGGGIYNTGAVNGPEGTVIIQGGSITANKAVSTSLPYSVGGGIYNKKGSLTIEGGSIGNNAALQTNASKPYGQGGGIYNTSSGTVTVNGGTISGNKGSRGGGISNFGTLVMTGGEITGNYGYGYEKDESQGISESEGVAGVLNCCGTMTMTGGTISNNIADKEEWGGGLCNRSEGSTKASLTVGGTAVISGNTAASRLSNVMQYMKEDATEAPSIEVSAETPFEEGAAVGISVQDADFAQLHSVVSGAAETDLQYFSSDSDDYELRFDADHLELAAAVRFDLQGHGTAIDSEYVIYGNKVSRPDDPAEEGYTFGGWYKEAAYTNEWDFDSDTVAAPTTLYARWLTMPAFALSPTKAGGRNGRIIDVDSSMEYCLEDGEGGWTAWTAVSGTEIAGIGLEEGDRVRVRYQATATAAASRFFELTIPEFEVFEVTFNMNGHGEQIAPATASTATPSIKNKEPDRPTEAGWIFKGWFADNALQKAWNFVKDYVTKNLELFAKWIRECTVTYDANEAETGRVPKDKKKYEEGQEVTVLGNPGKLKRKGYTFSGWNTEADGSGTVYEKGEAFTIEDNTVLYADWTRNSYYVSYDANEATEGSIPADREEYRYEDTVTVLDNTGKLAKTGYMFAGWNTKADGSGKTYRAGDEFTIEEDVVLYARWTLESLDDDNDGKTYEKPKKTGTWDDPVTDGTWIQVSGGAWSYRTNAVFRNTWGYILNPYAKTEADRYAWFWFDADGKMETGWVKIGGSWFYFNETNDGTLGAMKQGWITWNGNRYYLTETRDSNGGKMLENTTTPDGRMVDETGKMVR